MAETAQQDPNGFHHAVDADGEEFAIPHLPDIDATLPFSTDGMSRWEVQELRRAFRSADRAARQVLHATYDILAKLHSGAPPEYWTLDAMGNRQVASQVTSLTVALTELVNIHNGAKHRLALAEKQR